jgi:hypothetical protein
MFGNVQQVCRRFHCRLRTATLGRPHRDAVCREQNKGLAALEAGLHFGCLHAGPGFYPLLKNTKKRADLEFEIFFFENAFFFDFFLFFFEMKFLNFFWKRFRAFFLFGLVWQCAPRRSGGAGSGSAW